MPDEKMLCTYCKKGYFVEETGITSKATLYFCNNCFKYKDGANEEDAGSMTSEFHSGYSPDPEDYFWDDWG